MNNILKFTAYSIGAASASYVAWSFLSYKALNTCESYKPRIDSIKATLDRIEKAIEFIDIKGLGNCYSANRLVYSLRKKHKSHIMKEEDINEYLIFDELFRELIVNKNKFKEEFKGILDISNHYKNTIFAYECFNLQNECEKSERGIKVLNAELQELVTDNYLRLCNSSAYNFLNIESKYIDFGIND